MLKQKSSWIILTLLCLFAFMVWLLNFFLRPDFFNSEDAAIYADIARNIINNKGPVSNSLYPVFLAKIPPSLGPWPSIYPLFYPLVLALGFLILGVSENTSALISGIFFISTLPLLFLLAKKLFNQKVALLASLWYIFNHSLIGFSLSGMTESLFIFLTTASIYLLFLVNSPLMFLPGALIALSYLTRNQGILFLPVILGFLLFRKDKQIKSAIYFLIGFFVPLLLAKLLLPPTALNYENIQNSTTWTVIAMGGIIPARGVLSIFEPITLNTVIANLDLVFKKTVFNLFYLFQGLFTATIPTIVVLYILSFFLSLSKRVRQFRILTLLLLIASIFFHLITIFDFRYLQTLLPFVIMLAADTFLAFLEKFAPRKIFLYTAIFTLLFIIVPTFTYPGSGTAIQRALARPRKPTVLYLLGEIAKENIAQKKIVLSDRAPHIAWYSSRKSILLPLKPEDLKIIDKKIPVDALILSNYYPEHFPLWQDLIENPHAFDNFYPAKTFTIKPEENYYRIPVKAVLYLKKTTPSLPK